MAVAIKRSTGRLAWPDAQQLQVNRTYLKQELAHRIAVYEDRYEMTSCALVDAVGSGRVTETDEVCSWLIDLDALATLENG